MKHIRKLSGTLAAALVIVTGAGASAQNYGSKEANLQAMRSYAQQQMNQGQPNPYPGVNLSNGQGFSELRNGLTNSYGSNWGNSLYGNNYGYGNGYGNPYVNGYGNGYGDSYGNAYGNAYGSSNTYGNPYGYGNGYGNQMYGYNGGSWY